MSPLERSFEGEVLVLDLTHEQEQVEGEALERTGRSARTLIKSGPMRVTLISLAPGGEIAEHQAEGPITVQPVSGTIRFTAAGHTHELRPGQLLSLAPGIRHAVASPEGGAFLLTLASQ